MASGFSQEQFREACAELQQPALAGAEWQLMMETLGISIYRLLDQVAACLLEDCGAAACQGQPSPGTEVLQPRKSGPGRVFWSWEERALGRCLQLTWSSFWERGGRQHSALGLRPHGGVVC